MEKPSAIQGDYADYKRVPSRKVFQIIVEVPIERAAEVHKILGEPNPAESTPVAIAKLNQTTAEKPNAYAPQREYTTANKAALMVKEQSFAMYISAELFADPTTDPKDWLKTVIGIDSLSELNEPGPAQDHYMRIKTSYEAWQRGIDA